LLSLALLGHPHRPLEFRRRDREVAARRGDVGVAGQVADVMERHASFEPAAGSFAPQVVEVQVLDLRAATGRAPRRLDAVQLLPGGVVPICALASFLSSLPRALLRSAVMKVQERSVLRDASRVDALDTKVFPVGTKVFRVVTTRRAGAPTEIRIDARTRVSRRPSEPVTASANCGDDGNRQVNGRCRNRTRRLRARRATIACTIFSGL
jgi:hypothetical protein